MGGVSGIVSVLSCRLSKTDQRQSIWHFDIIHFLLEMLPSANVTEFSGCFIIFAVLLLHFYCMLAVTRYSHCTLHTLFENFDVLCPGICEIETDLCCIRT
jgi:hypothetical protein